MKKLIAAVICLLMIISLCACGEDAENEGIIAHVECAESASAGDIVTFTLILNDKVMAKMGGVEVIYDYDVFELVVPEWTVKDALVKHYDVETDLGGFMYESATAIEGEVFFVKFRVLEDAPKGPSRVQCNLKLQDASNVSIELENRSAVIEIR